MSTSTLLAGFYYSLCSDLAKSYQQEMSDSGPSSGKKPWSRLVNSPRQIPQEYLVQDPPKGEEVIVEHTDSRHIDKSSITRHASTKSLTVISEVDSEEHMDKSQFAGGMDDSSSEDNIISSELYEAKMNADSASSGHRVKRRSSRTPIADRFSVKSTGTPFYNAMPESISLSGWYYCLVL